MKQSSEIIEKEINARLCWRRSSRAVKRSTIQNQWRLILSSPKRKSNKWAIEILGGLGRNRPGPRIFNPLLYRLLLADSSHSSPTRHNLQVVHCSKLEPYIYWGLLVICTTHQLHRKKNDLGISP
jgi:hypothetical protein